MNTRIESLLNFLREDPDDSFVLYSLAQEYTRVGNVDEGRRYYHRLRQNNPGYIALYYHLGKLEESAGNPEVALEVYRDGIQRSADAGDHHTLGELKGALQLLEFELDE